MTGVLAALAALLLLTVVALLRRDLPLAELVESYTDEASRFLEIDGLRVHYKDQDGHDPEGGGRPPIVLLHGTASSLHTWDGWARALGRSHRVIRMDLPGCGITGPNREHRYTFADYVAFLDAFLGALGVERAVLAGNSRGGGIAWLYAATHPERVSHLVLVDTAGLPHPPIRAFQLAAVPIFGRWSGPRWGTRHFLRQMVYGDAGKVSDELVDRYHRLQRRPGNRAALAAMLRRPGSLPRRQLSRIEAPTLILWGKRDRVIPFANAGELEQAIPGSELVAYDDLGHTPMEEAPERTARDVQTFMARHPG